MPLTTGNALFSIPIMALALFLTRVLPFALFSKKDPPKAIQFAANHLPPLVMMVLVIYCLKDCTILEKPHALPEIAAILFCTLTYLYKHNAMISIFGGTLIYMFFVQILF